jgi:hypothetical protein
MTSDGADLDALRVLLLRQRDAMQQAMGPALQVADVRKLFALGMVTSLDVLSGGR